jgi:hypothetical protein
MVRAILDGRKTQTRRRVKFEWCQSADDLMRQAAFDPAYKCPHGVVGDRLWVRETWAMEGTDGTSPLPLQYRADRDDWLACAKWRPSIHMPRWASRITLEITAVRVERLQDITEEDAQKEGVESVLYREERFWRAYGHNPLPGGGELTATRDAKRSFQTLWSSINGPDSWASNPWVWVIEFRRVQP